MERVNNTLLLTFDYELYLQESGHIYNCLILPTQKILSVLNKYNAKATFFVDSVYLLKLKETNKNDYSIIESQLKQIIQNGSRIELHIHPHWIDASYRRDSNDFVFCDYSNYKHDACPRNIYEHLFNESIKLLNDIAKQVDPSYSITAFRAGGWCVDPFSNIEYLFKKHNLLIDSSVIPRSACNIEHQSYDYNDIVNDLPYRFEDDVHKINDNGSYIEIPISIYKYSTYGKICHFIRKIINRNNLSRYGDGVASIPAENRKFNIKTLKYLFTTSHNFLALDGFAYLPSRHYLLQKRICTVVGHPKSFTNISLYNLDSLCKSFKHIITLQEYYLHNNHAN